MTLLKFYFVGEAKMPIKAVREDKAFINEKVPHLFAFLARTKKEKSRSPRKELWNGLRPKEFPIGLTYPKIDEHAWFTYKKTSNDKVKRVTLADYLKG